jgi:uncharacterized protein (TIGR03067 family)
MRYLLAGISVLGVLWGVSAGGDDAAVKKDLQFLHHDGIRRENEESQNWTLTMKDGARFGGPKSKEQFQLYIGADGVGKVRNQNEFWEIKVTVDPGKKPKTMDIEYQSGPHKGKKQFAIYKFEKDRLIMVATNPGAAEKDRPKASDKRDAKKTTVLEFNRQHSFVIE